MHLSNTGSALLQMQNVRFSWKNTPRDYLSAHFHIAEFDMAPKEKVFIHGPSGCGKSTFLSLCAGINTPDSGQFQILGQELAQLKAGQRDQFRVDHLGIIFQQFNLIPYLDLISNVLLPCQFSTRRLSAACLSIGSDQLKLSIAQDAAKQLLNQLGIAEINWTKPAGNLSIGQQQRVAAARALIGCPQLIIADEPTSALDEMHQQSFMERLICQCNNSSAGLIFVSHDQRLATHFNRKIDCQQWQMTTP